MHKLEHLNRRGIQLRLKTAKIWRVTGGNKPTEVDMTVNFCRCGQTRIQPTENS